MHRPSRCGWVQPGRHAAGRGDPKLDHGRITRALAGAQNAFGDKVLPLYLPTGDGLIGLLSQTHYEYSDGKRTTHAPDASYTDRIEEHRGALIEGIIEESEDESLMERYLGGEQIDQPVLIDDLEKPLRAVPSSRSSRSAAAPASDPWNCWRSPRADFLSWSTRCPRCSRHRVHLATADLRSRRPVAR